MLRLAFALALLPGLIVPGVSAAQSEQMLRRIESGLRTYQIRTDVSQLTNAQATAIFFELSESPKRTGDYSRKRQRIMTIIRRGEDF